MRQAAGAIDNFDSFETKLLGIEKYKELNINKVCIYDNNLTVECTLGECKFKIELEDARIRCEK